MSAMKRGSMRGRGKRREPEIRKEDVLRAIQQMEGRSGRLSDLFDEFDTSPTSRRQIKNILVQLVQDGRLRQHKGGRFEAQASSVEGTLMLHRDGYGFVVPSRKIDGIDSDIFIPAALTGSAMNGDKVQVEITYRKAGGRAEGRIAAVTTRAHETVVGRLGFDGRTFFVAPADEKLPGRILIEDDVSEHKDKMVEVEITRFPSASHWPVGRIVAVIGFLDDPNVETQVILRKFALPLSFPPEVEAEAARLPDGITEADLAGRDDFRGRNTITIDPTTARDFDDAIDVDELPDGSFQLGVHIADVSHFVRPNSAMDTEARLRGTSVYFPDRVLPMLPERVSNHLCSLNPRADRLAMSVTIRIGRDGAVLDYTFHQSVIHSKERMTYDDVQKIIDGDAALSARYAAILPDIQRIGHLARILQRRRQATGTIDFDLPEPMLTYNDSGDVTGIAKSIRHFSHRIVEEFMVLTNEVVARHLEEREIPSLYRVHEAPSPAKVESFAEIVAAYGLKFQPKRLHPMAFQRFIASIEGRPEERMLSYLMLRSFKQAVYSADNIGHFGLASPSYTHFTSPIRRYPDLVVHRILRSDIARRSKASLPKAQLDAIASESSERERIAAQAERELFEWKKMLLMERRLGDTFEAIVIGVWKDGFNVELIDQFVEGFVSVAELPDGRYQFDASARALIARNGRRRFRLGDRIRVQVARVDKLLRRAYFTPVLEKPPVGAVYDRPRSVRRAIRKKRGRS
ncbi:MAG TPA: ribonuclease R [Terriglobia bacterium]|nr:ribonuclease R [Terriglobia bacterium]